MKLQQPSMKEVLLRTGPGHVYLLGKHLSLGRHEYNLPRRNTPVLGQNRLQLFTAILVWHCQTWQ